MHYTYEPLIFLSGYPVLVYPPSSPNVPTYTNIATENIYKMCIFYLYIDEFIRKYTKLRYDCQKSVN